MIKRTNKANKKGFTLAELLIVMAIIGVLVAISFPIFSGKMEQARIVTDKANIRAAKAAATAEYLMNGATDKKYFDAENGAMVSDKTKIKAYGQTTKPASAEGTIFDKKHQGMIIRVTYPKSEESNQITFKWVKGNK